MPFVKNTTEGTTQPMSYDYDCPYLDKVQHGVIRCECARIELPDKESHIEFLITHCGHATKYKECQFYKLMEAYYKRKYGEDAEW